MGIVQVLFSWLARPGRTRSITVGGRRRRYYVHVPPGHDPEAPAPVVLALHGATMNGPMMAWFTGLNATADEAGFLAVYPDGTGRRGSYFWNGGPDTGPAAEDRVDDVAFVRAVLDDLARTDRVDPRRVYATGLSNGAFMAYRLAAELSDRIAAVAPVAGTMGAIDCRPTRPVPVLHVHGTEDEYVPFAGGRGPRSLTGSDYRSVEDTIRAWVTANGCRGEPAVEDLPDTARDGTTVTTTTYGGGRDGAEVVLVTVHGGGHTWPGRDPRAKVLGRPTRNVSANDLIWDFFRRHPMG
jgi:polyhydroxybutyrate depolymerase